MSKVARGVGRRSTRLHPAPEPLAAKRPDTKTLLMETAERLFGQHGLDGISLREIAAAAGQSNSNVVQYHFKDKEGLISAILIYRVRHLEIVRSELIQNLPTDKSLLTRALLKILWLPATTIIGADGSHTFCRFLLQYLIHPHNVQHPLLRTYDTANKSDAQYQEYACLIKATRMLREIYAVLPPQILNRRLSALSMMFLSTIVEYDNAQLLDKTSAPFEVEPVLDMAIAALNAPA